MVQDGSQILAQRDAEIARIAGVADLTQEAKDRRINEVREKAEADYTRVTEAAERSRQERLASARQAVYAVPVQGAISAGETAQIYSAYRDVWAVVEIATQDPSSAEGELGAMLDQATRTGDQLLARAVWHRALDLQNQPIIDRYLETYPSHVKSYERYVRALEEEREAQDVGSLLSRALIGQQFGA